MNNLEELKLAHLRCANEAQAKTLVADCNVSNAFVSIHDENAVYLSGSKNIQDITGHFSDSLVGNSGYDYFHPVDYKDVFMSHAKTTLKDGISTVSYRYRKSDGTYLPVVSLSKRLTTEKGEKLILVLTILTT